MGITSTCGYSIRSLTCLIFPRYAHHFSDVRTNFLLPTVVVAKAGLNQWKSIEQHKLIKGNLLLEKGLDAISKVNELYFKYVA